MSARRYHVSNPLKPFVSRVRGYDRTEAVRRAEESVQTLRGQIVGQIDADLDEIIASAAAADPSPEVRARLYELGRRIHGTAGLFDMGNLGAAAYSFCELIDRLDETGGWSRAAVAVHLNAMRVLRHSQDAAEVAAMLDALARLVRHVAGDP
jgi:hypothetical protein